LRHRGEVKITSTIIALGITGISQYGSVFTLIFRSFWNVKRSQAILKSCRHFSTFKAAVENLSQDAQPLFNCHARKELIQKECSYLDKALNAIIAPIEEGDLAVITTLMKISETRCKLLALDQPRNNIADAIALLSQYGVLRDKQASSTIRIMDEEDFSCLYHCVGM
jgi:hypothetical protein